MRSDNDINSNKGNKMVWMEIIELRSTEPNKLFLKKQLSALIQDVEKNNDDIGMKIFSRFKIDTDFRIYLKHKYSTSIEKGSQIGQSLVLALKEYGLVNYTIWIEFQQEFPLQKDQ